MWDHSSLECLLFLFEILLICIIFFWGISFCSCLKYSLNIFFLDIRVFSYIIFTLSRNIRLQNFQYLIFFSWSATFLYQMRFSLLQSNCSSLCFCSLVIIFYCHTLSPASSLATRDGVSRRMPTRFRHKLTN